MARDQVSLSWVIHLLHMAAIGLSNIQLVSSLLYGVICLLPWWGWLESGVQLGPVPLCEVSGSLQQCS